MDIMLILQIIVLLGAIFIGVRLGGIGIGYADPEEPVLEQYHPDIAKQIRFGRWK